VTVSLQQAALTAYLKARDKLYFGKVLELREAVKNWLSYIPHTFPHYTRHTVEHSDNIVLQVSKLLFEDDDPEQPVVRLSAAEAYILIAASYLHDAGMVVPDREKIEILASDAWKNWTSGEGGGARRWKEVQALRQSREPFDDTLRNFLADIQTRFLIAEFVRLTHHRRATDIITHHQATLGRFAFDDPMLLRTISDVCVAHGLRQHELEDRERYPERRDIRGQLVNVRFIATLLRLGDLLDMSHDRACPLLLNAASPLPAESLAHWTQYQRITHRLTSPDTIEVVADCHSQEEHRFLQDWCQWMADEVQEAGTFMARAARHNDWPAPRVSLHGGNATIKIRPDASATYVPSKWTFELDHEAVLQRLISDVYSQPTAFVRELLQNALDANRSQMYADLVKDGLEAPEYPTQVNEERRGRYSVKVGLKTKEISNPLSGETERRQLLIVEDHGIGMDTEIIQRYFLQVGRSYYTTDEFRRTFRFIPTSRFGLGFLSVFAVSDQVVVETYKPSSMHSDGPLRLTLTGPRSYLLTDRGKRRVNETRIEVLLREQMEPGDLTEVVSDWCRRVEFPVIVDDLGSLTTINSELPEQFAYERPVVTDEESKFVVRAFPTNRPGIDGELYIFALIDESGESWAAWPWARYTYPKEHPSASTPPFPGDLVCLHGIAITQDHGWFQSEPMSARLDYRGESYHPSLSREASLHRPVSRQSHDPEIVSRWEEILREHLATSPHASSQDGWKYKQKLVELFPLRSFWASCPDTLKIYVEGKQTLTSLNELLSVQDLDVIIPAHRFVRSRNALRASESSAIQRDTSAVTYDKTTIVDDDLVLFSDQHLSAIFKGRSVSSVERSPKGDIILHWIWGENSNMLFSRPTGRSLALINWPDPTVIGFQAHRTSERAAGLGLLNEGHPLVQWLVRIRECCAQNVHDLTEEQFERLIGLLETPVLYTGLDLSDLSKYLDRWRNLPGLPSELYPPALELTRDMFIITKEGDGPESRK
jgi:molecular chaperone HtpG